MTPRTDAQHAKWRIADDPYGAMTEHARSLERELIGALEALKIEIDRYRAELRDLIELADTAMLLANRDGAEYDRQNELHSARAAIEKATS
jgi:hypothetical protein